MPEYLAPGVYVEEVSFRAKSIEGVSTSTAGFVGPTRYGPITLEPDLLTSLGEFERVYGDGQQLKFKGLGQIDNYMWNGARAFFEEGGKRLYVQRVFLPISTDPETRDDGIARETVGGAGGDEKDGILVQARFQGAAGNLQVRLTLRLGQNILGGDTVQRRVGGLQPHDVVWLGDFDSPLASPLSAGGLYWAEDFFDQNAPGQRNWRFHDRNDDIVMLDSLFPSPDPGLSDQIRVVTMVVTVYPTDPTGLPQVWDGLSLDPGHQRFGVSDDFTAFFAEVPLNQAQARTLPLIIRLGDNLHTGLDVIQALNAYTVTGDNPNGQLIANLGDLKSSETARSVNFMLKGGNDGQRPSAEEYKGKENEATGLKTGLVAFEDLDDISIVAAPGSTFGYENGYRSDAATILSHLISHCELMRYRIAVLDSGDNQTISAVRAMRGKLDSKYAAFYYPWVRLLDPITRKESNFPPSGFVAGIYARNDINRAVYKAPANEVVNLAIGFETLLNKSQQDVLNPEGINCFRFFEGRGYRLWGARTTSSDPEWKYVNLRRYFAYLEHSIDKGTQWAVFEPNGEALWANVRRTIEDFLFNEWQSGALLGDKPEKAYFVKCDRSTMTQNDLDNGRLVCQIGVAPLRPAEYVIFRIGQFTADRKQ